MWSLLTVRGESLAAFDGRCILAGCVAPPLNAHDRTRFDELLHPAFAEEHLAICPREVTKRLEILERALDFVPENRDWREVGLELRILEALREGYRIRKDPGPMRAGHDDRASSVDNVLNEPCAVRRG